MSFGGYDLGSYAKQGKSDKDIIWADIGSNEAYWTINAEAANLGAAKITNGNQNLILDNGMSLAMAPMSAFKNLLVSLKKNHQVTCIPMQGAPVLPCQCNAQTYDSLPDINFGVVKNANGEKADVKMPKEAYMKFATDGQASGCMLMINPWNFAGLGGKQGEEYWVLGAQFLQHYYSIYDYKDKKIGLVESKTSAIGEKNSVTAEKVEPTM